MRQIGTIDRELDAQLFADYLLSLGITTRLDDRPDGTVVWVHNEDQLEQARMELEAYRMHPDDPRYAVSVQAARKRRLEREQLDRQYRKNYRNLSGHWDRPNLRRRPLTTALIAICVALYMLWSGPAEKVYDLFTFTTWSRDDFGGLHSNGLNDILHGEVWRLFTPVLLHFNILHLLFDMWALWVLGSLIEVRRGTRALAFLVLATAAASNIGQFIYDVGAGHELAQFGGMSGVVYALFGYIWMKGRFEPEQGMILHPSTVTTMLLWLVICFTGAFGSIANAAHVVGLVAGMMLGLARF